MKSLIRKLAAKGILNNIVFNNILIFLRLDGKFANYIHHYTDFVPDRTKSLQEIAGYSDHPEINAVMSHVHVRLKDAADKYAPNIKSVLDIGCGPGLFLMDHSEDVHKSGNDITGGMLEICEEQMPDGSFYKGDFMGTEINEKYDFIQSVGFMIYLNRSSLDAFFSRVNKLLNEEGVFFLSYPHAISKRDLYYPNINYIQYSPELLERQAGKYFHILESNHVIDDRKVKDFDRSPYTNPINPKALYYKNSSVLILKKK